MGLKETGCASFVILLFVLIAIFPASAQTVASLTYPPDGSANLDPTLTFAWTPIAGVQAYYLYVGSAPGLKDIYDSGETSATSVTVRFPFGGKYYARLYTEIDNIWHYAPDVAFTTATPAALQTPANQSTGLQDPVQFSWAPAAGASVYYLYVGTTPGAKDAYDSGEVQATQLSCALRTGTYYARLWTKFGSHWYFLNDITFSAVAPPPAQLTLPANGAVLSGASAASFSWTAVPNATVYYLYVGTSLGAKDVIDTGEITATQYSRMLNPGTYYARIYTEIAQSWYSSSDISFSVIAGSLLGFPQNGATGVDPYVNFSWQPFPNATGYSLSVGTTPGASNALATGTITATSFQVASPLQPNTTYYVQLGTSTAGGWTYSNSTFTTSTGIAHLLSPADGSVNIDPASTLNWNSVLDAQTYYVYVGSAQGLKDVYDSGEIAANSLAVPTKPNTQYFIRLWTKKSSTWYFADSTFATGTGIAQMVYPADKATNVDPALPFQWSADPRALGYVINIGTTLGAKDIYESGEVQTTSLSIPVTGNSTIYIRLYTQRADGWRYIDSSFRLGNFIAHLTTPADQSLADPYATFTWTTAPNADAYYVYVGSTKGAKDVFDSGEVTVNSLFVPNLAARNTYYVRLFTFREGAWRYSDSTFLAGTGLAVLSDPQDGTAVSPFETFTWSVPQFPADAYYLIIGTSPGARDVFDSGALQGTSVKPAGLDFGKTYYATLSSLKNNIWWPVQSTFSTLDQSAIPDLATVRANFYTQIQQATAAVRMMADPATNLPAAGTPLDVLLKQEGLTLASCFQYAQALTQQLLPMGIAARLRGISLTGTSFESHTPVEYYDPFLGKWAIADPTFGVLFFDPTTQTGQSVEDVQALVLASNFAGIHVTTVTSYGDSVLRSYYLDPLTLYVNVFPVGQNQPTKNSPLPFLRNVSMQDIGGHAGVYLFSFGSSSEQMQISPVPNSPLILVPTDGTLFSKAVGVLDGWTLDTAPADVQAYIFLRPVY